MVSHAADSETVWPWLIRLPPVHQAREEVHSCRIAPTHEQQDNLYNELKETMQLPPPPPTYDTADTTTG